VTTTKDDILDANVVHVKGDLDALDLIARRDVTVKGNSLPRGQIGYKLVSAQQNITTSAVTVLTGLSVTVKLASPRMLKATLFVTWETGSANIALIFTQILMDGSSALTQVSNAQSSPSGSFGVSSFTAPCTVPAGTHVFTAVMSFSTANAGNNASPGSADSYLLIEDAGGT
jgi:hypothetical protein